MKIRVLTSCRVIVLEHLTRHFPDLDASLIDPDLESGAEEEEEKAIDAPIVDPLTPISLGYFVILQCDL